MAVWTPTPFSVPFCNTATHLTGTHDYPPPCVSLDDRSAILSQSTMESTFLTKHGKRPYLTEKRPSETATCGLQKDCQHIRGSYLHCQWVTMSEFKNQTGPHPTKWDKTGIVIEVRQFDQYVVRVDGSGRVTLRNRKFLRHYVPVVPRSPLASLPAPTVPHTTNIPRPPPEPQKISLTSPRPVTARENIQSSPLPETNTQPCDDHFSDSSGQETPEPPVAPTVEVNRPPNTSTARLPRSLRALQPYNKSGLKETPLPETRLRSKIS